MTELLLQSLCLAALLYIPGSQGSCYQGFAERLPDESTYHRYSTLQPMSDFILPHLKFTCDGTINALAVPWFAEQLYGNNTRKRIATAYVTVWRKNESKYVLTQSVRFRTPLCNTKLDTVQSEMKGISRPLFNISVKKNDFLGFTLPDPKKPMFVLNRHLPILYYASWIAIDANCSKDEGNCLLVPQHPYIPIEVNFTEQSDSNPEGPGCNTDISICTNDHSVNQDQNVCTDQKGPANSANNCTGGVSLPVMAALITTIAILLVVIVIMIVIIVITFVKMRHYYKGSLSSDCGNNTYSAHPDGNNSHVLTPMLTYGDADTSASVTLRPSYTLDYETIDSRPANGAGTSNHTSTPGGATYSELVHNGACNSTLSDVQDLSSIVESPAYSTIRTKEQYENSRKSAEYSGYHYVPSSTQRQHAAQGTPGVESPYDFVISNNLQLQGKPNDENSNVYWPPEMTATAIYDQLSSKKYIEIPSSSVTIEAQLGEGEFGLVYRGAWHSSTKERLVVAVKALKSTASNDERVKLLQEAAIMGQFRHPHTVGMYGIVTVTEPVKIILEYMANGDLKNYLKELRKRVAQGDGSHLSELLLQLLQFCQEIADGMRYLSRKGFIHRDLAARNILLTEDNQCKIGDFGLSRHLSDEYYYKSKGGRIPIKWTAPEAVLYKKYTTKSDVWSYGMVMYEIWSLGRKPFDDWDIQKIVNALQSGYCLPPPPGCSRDVYSVMVTCWNCDFHARPTFDRLHQTLIAMTADKLHLPTEKQRQSSLEGTIGAPLKHSDKLHIDLQMVYKK